MNRILPKFVKVNDINGIAFIHIPGKDLDSHGYGPEHLDKNGELWEHREDFIKICDTQIKINRERNKTLREAKQV